MIIEAGVGKLPKLANLSKVSFNFKILPCPTLKLRIAKIITLLSCFDFILMTACLVFLRALYKYLPGVFVLFGRFKVLI